jgi:PAS domain S-box-containing protein
LTDITDRELQNLRSENDRLRRQLAKLSQLGLQITSSLDLSTVLQQVVDAACELTGAQYGALGLFDHGGHIHQFITHGISPEERERIGDLPQGLGILGWLHHLQQPLRLADLSQHPRSVGFPPNHPPMKSFLGAPLSYQEENLGTLYLTEKTGQQEFTPEDEHLLLLFASQAALSILNAHRFEQEQLARAEAERAFDDRTIAEAEREQERQRLRSMVEASPVGVLVINAGERQIELANREAVRILGAAHQVGHKLDENILVHRRPDGHEYDPGDLPAQRALNRGESVHAEEVRFEFSDGHSVPTLVSATPVHSGDGQITGAIVIIQDITPLEEVEKLRNEFLGIVSHELRTPLTAIKGSAATVLGSRRPLSEAEMRDFFEIIDEQADRLRDLVDNLLDMTRIEAGSLSVSTAPADLGEMLDEATATFARSGGAHEIEVQIPAELPPLDADRRRIGQVLGNLLSNAAKFSPATAPIHIAASSDGVMVTVRVKDDGRGIPPEKLPYLFRKFSQVHEDDGANLSGTGLGLAICRGIIEAHGGRIWAESPGEGKGTTFSFTMPLAHQTEDARSLDTTRRDQHVGRVRRSQERSRVLVIDDEAQILRYLERTLNDAGYHVISSGDPTRVIGLVESEEPDLVLMDLMLPGPNGFDLLQQIRGFSGVPVIFLTARDRDEDMVQALRMGADDYITKPFSPTELLARIEVVLRRRVLPDQMEVRPPFLLDDLSINFAERRVIMGGAPIALSATEYKILYELATHAGMVLTHEQILQRVWGPDYGGETELVRSFIRNLRRKLGDDARNPRYVFTEPQVGYRMPRPD